jgi:hypothetical protein
LEFYRKREAVLQLRYASFEIKKPHILNSVKTLPDSIEAQVIYVKEEKPLKGRDAIEWL